MMSTRIRIFYPADPVGVVPGGIDTFLRGMIKWAPQDIAFSLVGMTTDATARPLFWWSQAVLGSREFSYYPVVAVENAGTRGRIPLSVRYMWGLQRDKAFLRSEFDVFDFHRLEPSFLFRGDKRPKNAYFHQDPEFVRLSASDNLWRHLPSVYERIERQAMQSVDSAWCVRESGVQVLQQRYPDKAARLRFIPTWVDTELFFDVDRDRRLALRAEVALRCGLDTQRQWVVSVGRLDTQKDPMLLLAAFARLRQQGLPLSWLVVGDGVLREPLLQTARQLGVAVDVHFLGLQTPAAIADILRAADVFALSSAYEGMPMALLEALGSGLPAVVTDVGEVRRVMQEGVNGAVARDRTPEAFAVALQLVLAHADAWRGAAVQKTVDAFHPASVLAPAYDNYRVLAHKPQSAVSVPAAVQRAPGVARVTCEVLGVPIDAIAPAVARKRLMAWAQARESRCAYFVNVHSTVLAGQNTQHQAALLQADFAAPDGAPIAWTLRQKGHATQQRVDGPGTMWQLCHEAEEQDIPIGLYGSTQDTLDALVAVLHVAFPALQLAYVYSPPFRPMSAEEEEAVCDAIRQAGVGLLFVGLGCPKQELWIARMRGRIPAVMLGVGAAFQFHAGTISRAPKKVRALGLEWLHRMLSEPRRLFWRYTQTNSIFIVKSASEMLQRFFSKLRGVA